MTRYPMTLLFLSLVICRRSRTCGKSRAHANPAATPHSKTFSVNSFKVQGFSSRAPLLAYVLASFLSPLTPSVWLFSPLAYSPTSRH